MSVSDYFKFSHKHHCFIDNDKEVIKVNLHTKLFSELIDTYDFEKVWHEPNEDLAPQSLQILSTFLCGLTARKI